MILPLLSAVLGVLAFLPFNFFWLIGFIFLTPLFIFYLKEKKLGRLLFGTFIFRLIFALGTVFYAFEPINWSLSILIFLGLPVLIFIIKKFINFFSLSPLVSKNKTKQILITQEIIFLPSLLFLWIFFDNLEARFSLLPTYLITTGNILGSSPFLGLASIGGLRSLTFLLVLINYIISLLIINKFKSLNQKMLVVVIIIFVIYFFWQFSQIQLKKNLVNYEGLDNSLSVAVVSVNKKFNLSDFNQIQSQLLSLKNKPDLLVLPEDMFNDYGDVAFYQKTVENLKISTAANLKTENNNKEYNSTILFDGNGKIEGVYNKNILAFIGEYWPFGNWRPFYFNWIEKINPAYQNYSVFQPKYFFSPGNKKILIFKKATSTVAFASLICLEINYPDYLEEYKKMGAQFAINPSSNRWLTTGLTHFLYLVDNLKRIEAVWLKIPIISSGVDDYAGIITPDGRSTLLNYDNQNKNFNIFIGNIKFKNIK